MYNVGVNGWEAREVEHDHQLVATSAACWSSSHCEAKTASPKAMLLTAELPVVRASVLKLHPDGMIRIIKNLCKSP